MRRGKSSRTGEKSEGIIRDRERERGKQGARGRTSTPHTSCTPSKWRPHGPPVTFCTAPPHLQASQMQAAEPERQWPPLSDHDQTFLRPRQKVSSLELQSMWFLLRKKENSESILCTAYSKRKLWWNPRQKKKKDLIRNHLLFYWVYRLSGLWPD